MSFKGGLQMGELYIMLDGYSLMYRAYHGLQTPMNAPDGTPTNAVHGFFSMLFKVLEEEKPDGIAVAFDVHAKTLRAQKYSGYKATRKPMPEELRAQDDVIREIISLMHIPILEMAGYEADDIMGTVSLKCETEGKDIILVTGDRDSFQLSGEHTSILYTRKGITDTVRVTPEWIMEKYELTPAQMIDVKGLMGDVSDNIPGIAGIGEKTALRLIKQYGSLEEALQKADSEQKGKLRERLMEGRDSAIMSKELATIERAVPIEIDLDLWKIGRIIDALPRFRELGMMQISRKLEEAARLSERTAAAAISLEEDEKSEIEILESIPDLLAICGDLARDMLAVSIYIDSTLTLANEKRRIALPLGQADLFSPYIEDSDALSALEGLLSSDCPKVLYSVKDFPGNINDIKGEVHDCMLAAYTLNPQQPSYSATALCEAQGINSFADHPAGALLKLYLTQREALQKQQLQEVYKMIELPLAYVLRDMEAEGVLVDASILKDLGSMFKNKIEELIDQIEQMSGEKINLNSPKQLGELLFGKLGLPAPKKTSRGWSTSAEVLEHLAPNYPICERILEYRKYQKLESTYINNLITMRDSRGRVHTRFIQVGTATGRISSAEPNLQNIPVRTEIGKEIRRAFVASPGCVLVDADYSQIELRVLAHMSGDERMRDAFLEDQDIHSRTAAEVYGIDIEQVTPEMRSSCKAVNFGIIYGISDFTLAKNIGVSRREAQEFINRYFSRYPGVKRYMENAVATGRKQGYVTTLFNRRRYLPELSSPNFNVRSFGERCAMNSPIQGTAADIIKLAMIRVAERLKEKGLSAKLILQVHDELIIDTPLEESDAVQFLLRDCMENIVRLDVPLKVELSTGEDWRACK